MYKEKEKTMQNMTSSLKEAFLSMKEVHKADFFRKSLIKQLGWTRAVWFNKIHGKTAITPAEEKVIKDTKDTINNLKF
jgi:hypothetical protein